MSLSLIFLTYQLIRGLILMATPAFVLFRLRSEPQGTHYYFRAGSGSSGFALIKFLDGCTEIAWSKGYPVLFPTGGDREFCRMFCTWTDPPEQLPFAGHALAFLLISSDKAKCSTLLSSWPLIQISVFALSVPIPSASIGPWVSITHLPSTFAVLIHSKSSTFLFLSSNFSSDSWFWSSCTGTLQRVNTLSIPTMYGHLSRYTSKPFSFRISQSSGWYHDRDYSLFMTFSKIF